MLLATDTRFQAKMCKTLITEHNSLDDGRYYDTAGQTSFEVDHASQVHAVFPFLVSRFANKCQKASNSQQHPLDSQNADLIRSLQKSFSRAAAEHFPSSTIGVYPVESDSAVVMVLVANKYSPQNFWNGRWRSTYKLDTSSNALSGTMKVDVHYYEDGNVRMSTSKKIEVSSTTGHADAVVREIAKAENKFQEELNRGFTTLSEGSFKGLRRQLPVTRQRVEWEKIGGYRVSRAVGECHQCMLTGPHSLGRTSQADGSDEDLTRCLVSPVYGQQLQILCCFGCSGPIRTAADRFATSSKNLTLQPLEILTVVHVGCCAEHLQLAFCSSSVRDRACPLWSRVGYCRRTLSHKVKRAGRCIAPLMRSSSRHLPRNDILVSSCLRRA